MDGQVSSMVQVDSVFLQGNILGPLMLLLFINDIGDDTDCFFRLFANNSLLFLTILSTEDTTRLQKDLNTLHEWSNC